MFELVWRTVGIEELAVKVGHGGCKSKRLQTDIMGGVGLLVMTWSSIGPWEWITEEDWDQNHWKGRGWGKERPGRILSDYTDREILRNYIGRIEEMRASLQINPFISERERPTTSVKDCNLKGPEWDRWADTQNWVFSEKWEWKQSGSRARKRCNTTSCPVIKWVWERSQVSLLGMNNWLSLTQSNF